MFQPKIQQIIHVLVKQCKISSKLSQQVMANYLHFCWGWSLAERLYPIHSLNHGKVFFPQMSIKSNSATQCFLKKTGHCMDTNRRFFSVQLNKKTKKKPNYGANMPLKEDSLFCSFLRTAKRWKSKMFVSSGIDKKGRRPLVCAPLWQPTYQVQITFMALSLHTTLCHEKITSLLPNFFCSPEMSKHHNFWDKSLLCLLCISTV